MKTVSDNIRAYKNVFDKRITKIYNNKFKKESR